MYYIMHDCYFEQTDYVCEPIVGHYALHCAPIPQAT